MILLLSLLTSLANAQWNLQESGFKDLYNQYRVSQPAATPWAGSYFSYGGKGVAVKLSPLGEVSDSGTSPLHAYDVLAGISEQPENAEKWEIENHTCDKLKGKEQDECNSWWGHCNGWAAAAVREKEPTGSLKVGTQNFSVADQKGILTEMWLTSNSHFEGRTNKTKKTGSWVHKHNDPDNQDYQAFWDVSPRQFFLIFTNYVGVQKVGLVIDRFTGDEVWNQPVVGYRILPLRKSDIKKIDRDGQTFYDAALRMKIYWANDLGTPAGHVTGKLNIAKDTSDKEDAEEFQNPKQPGLIDFEGRLLNFTLSFDGPIEIEDGKIVSSGRMVGDGIWDHQVNSKNYSADDLNSSHPDFIWYPTSPFQDRSGYGNPYIDSRVVAKMLKGEVAPTAAKPAAGASEVKFVIVPKSLKALDVEMDPAEVRKFLSRVVRRAGIRASVRAANIEVTSAAVTAKIVIIEGSAEELRASLEAMGVQLK